MIKSNHSTIVNHINYGILFRGEWYFSKSLFNRDDLPLISNWSLKESNLQISTLVLEMINNAHIKRAIFVYRITEPLFSTETPTLVGDRKVIKECKLIHKFDGITHAEKELNINHDIIKKHAKLNTYYKGYLFTYDRLQSDSQIIGQTERGLGKVE